MNGLVNFFRVGLSRALIVKHTDLGGVVYEEKGVDIMHA